MSIRLHLSLIAALSVGAAGCDGGVMDEPDAARTRDAAVADGGGLLDAGPPGIDAGSVIDAASDAGSPLCVATVCDPRMPAEGCDSGQCVLRDEEASCVDTPGTLTGEEACDDVTSCAAGYACFLVDGRGVCERVCCPGDDLACPTDATCGGSGVLVDGTETTWGRCLARRRCSVLAPSEDCEAREGCYIVDPSGTTECRIAGSGMAGDACGVQEDCASGFFCGGLSPSKRCVRFCRIGADDCPDGEGNCVAQSHTSAFPGLGVCTVDASTAR